MMTPAVSVVIATRNYGRYVTAAIESVLQQTWRDLEIVVVDDGSTDDTEAIVRLFTDPRIRYHRTDGLGQSRAKNLGIELSRAPLIAFLDGDDFWMPDKLDRQLPLFDDAGVGVVYSRRLMIDAYGQPLPTPPVELARGEIYDHLLVSNPICFSSVIVRRTVLESVGMFDPKLPLAIDYDLWLRVARHLRFDYVDAPLVRYRTGHANLSSRIGERLAAVRSILSRSLLRRKNDELANRAAQSEAWAGTFRTLAYVQRDKQPLDAVRSYVLAARYDRRIVATLRGMTRAAMNFTRLLRR